MMALCKPNGFFNIDEKKIKSKPGTNTFLMDEKQKKKIDRALRGWILYACVFTKTTMNT